MDLISLGYKYPQVLISIISSFILFSGILSYKFFYPRKKISFLWLLILISILPLISVFRKGIYESGDLSSHIQFAMAFYANLKQGIFHPEWMVSQTVCSGYGCPAFIFVFLLSNYIISFFHFLGFTFIASAKLLIILSYISSGIGMFLWIRDEFGERPAFIASLLYLYAPYHLVDLHFRVSIGELLSMAILPFLFLTTKKIFSEKPMRFFLLNTILFALLITSHQVTSFASFPLLLIYGVSVWFRREKKYFTDLSLMLFSYLSGLLLSAFYWLPILIESKYTLHSNISYISFQPFYNFLISPNLYGFLFQGHKGEIYLSLGYMHWTVIILAVYILIKKKAKGLDKTILTGVLSLFLLIFFMMQPFSKPIWIFLPFLNNFQFSWRLLIEEILLVSMLSAVVIKIFPGRKLFITICTLTVLYTILNWGNRKTLPNISDSMIADQRIFAEYPGNIFELSPIWVNPNKKWIGEAPKKHMEIISGKGRTVESLYSITRHEYIVDAETNIVIKDNTFYYPGWKVFVDGQSTDIKYKNKSYPGIITFNLNKGLHLVEVIYTDTKDRLIASWVSILTAISLLILYILYKLRLTRFFPKR